MTVLPAVAFAALGVAFPGEGARLASVPRVHVIGAAEPGVPVYLNGVEVETSRTGGFVAMVKVREGTNSLACASGTNALVRTFVVLPPPDPSLPPPPPKPPRDPYADLGIDSNATRSARPPRGAKPPDVLVFVDPGHGGSDTGARSPHGWCEKEVNLLQAREIVSALERAGFRTALTRADDSFPALYDRPRRAIREGAGAFVSVHHNACAPESDPRKARHVVTYASNSNGLALARSIHRYVAEAVPGVPDRGVRTKSLAVCRNPVVPSCLLEIDFVDLPEGEEATWGDAARRAAVARAVALGLLDWLAEGNGEP